MTTISVVEDDRVFAELLVRYIHANKELELHSVSRNGIEALADISRHKPDVVLMDINLPRMNGIDCLRELKKFTPPLRTHVLVLTDYDESDLIFDAIRAGAVGYLLKDDTQHGERLSAAVTQVLAGEAPMSPGIARRFISHFQQPSPLLRDLTYREEQVLHLLARGLPYKQIADRLAISMNTVRKHLGSIYTKLQVHTRGEAMLQFLGQQPRQSYYTKM